MFSEPGSVIVRIAWANDPISGAWVSTPCVYSVIDPSASTPPPLQPATNPKEEMPSTSAPDHNASSCPAPKESCNVHLIKDPSKTLRVSLGCTSTLSSVWLWSTRPGGPPLLQDAGAQLARGFSLSLGLGDTETGCAVADYTGADPETPPYLRMALVCGSRTGDRLVLKMPRVAAAAPQPVAVAVKVCTMRGEAPAGAGDPVLYLQAPPGHM